MSKSEEDRCSYELSLYAHISKATFDHVADDCVRGTVSDPENHDVRTFVLTKTAGSTGTDAVLLVDRLWELIN